MKKAARKADRRKTKSGREGGVGLGVVTNAIVNRTLIDDEHGQTGVISEVATIGIRTHGTRGVGIGTDAGIGTIGANLGDAAGNGLTQLVALHSYQGLFIFDFHNYLPAFHEQWVRCYKIKITNGYYAQY